MKKFGKNFIIAFLMFLAIYQTAELWFENFSSHNFFSFQESKIELKDIGYTLERLIINEGNNRIVCRLNDINQSDTKITLDNTIATVISKGEFLGTTPLDWREILDNRCIIYKYNYVIQGTELKNMLGINKKGSDINKFNSIIITPNMSTGLVRVGFVDSVEENVYNYEFRKTALAEDAFNVINSYSTSEDDIYYISSLQNGFDIFDENTFIPRWQGQTTQYQCIDINNPVMEEGVISPALAEKYAGIYFDNPASKWGTELNGVYTYSDENTVVKFYKNGLLEYSGYQSSNAQGSEDSFYNNYIVATNFLLQDSNIKNEFYLTGYEKAEGRSIYRFDYRINDFDIVLSDDLKANTGLESAIEVVIDSSRVTKYRRYICDYALQENQTDINVDFLEAVDSVYSDIESVSGEEVADDVSRLELCYVVDNRIEKADLYWIIDVGGNTYFRKSTK